MRRKEWGRHFSTILLTEKSNENAADIAKSEKKLISCFCNLVLWIGAHSRLLLPGKCT